MTSLADFLMRKKLDALGEKPEYSTADVNALMPQQPSWDAPAWLKGIGSAELAKQEPNALGRALSYVPPEAVTAANFVIPGAKGLPRIPGFRPTAEQLARAQAEGFGPTVYYQGRETAYPGKREFQFVTDSPGAASMFADSSLAKKGVEGGRVIPLLVNEQGFPDLTSNADLARIAQRLAARTNISEATALEQLRDPRNIKNGRVNWAVEPIMSAAKEAGFPGVRVHENWGQWGWPDAHSLAIFDRSRLRSPVAKFDPANRGLDNLLGSVAAPALAAPALAAILQDQQSQ